jgi:hypothetical protein
MLNDPPLSAGVKLKIKSAAPGALETKTPSILVKINHSISRDMSAQMPIII